MNRIWMTAVLLALLAAPAAARSKAVEYLIAEALTEVCEGGGGGFRPGTAIERDLDGDGRDDLILDLHGVDCESDYRGGQCSGRFCPALIYLRREQLLRLEAQFMVSEGLSVGDGATPLISWHGSFDHDGVDAVRWDGAEFSPPARRSKAAEYLINEQLAQTCQGGVGAFDPGAVVERDFDGDGANDLLLNHHGVHCDAGFAQRRCGTQFCLALIYLRRGRLLQPAAEFMVGETASISDDPIPVLSWAGRIGEGEQRVRWNGDGFAAE